MASSSRQLHNALRQANINSSDDEWERRVERRLSAVAMIKNSSEYKKMINHRRSAEHSGTASTLSDLPEMPEVNDRTISKRAWEVKLMLWRAAIKQWCSVEGVDLVVVISESEGGIARLDRHDIRGR